MKSMTEREWLECTDSMAMATFLYYRYKDEEYPFKQHKRRKLDLLSCACLRRIWHLLVDERTRRVVEVLERSEEEGGEGSESRIVALEAAQEGSRVMADAADDGRYATPLFCAMPDAGYAAHQAIDGDLQCVGNAASAAACFAAGTLPNTPAWEAAYRNEMFSQKQIITCIFGNPFRPVTINDRWLTIDVTDLARAIYEDRAFDRMPILSDALMDAGCDNADILTHCRSGGPHVRGCWVVDLLLGKE